MVLQVKSKLDGILQKAARHRRHHLIRSLVLAIVFIGGGVPGLVLLLLGSSAGNPTTFWQWYIVSSLSVVISLPFVINVAYDATLRLSRSPRLGHSETLGELHELQQRHGIQWKFLEVTDNEKKVAAVQAVLIAEVERHEVEATV